MAIKAVVFDCFGVLYTHPLTDILQRNAEAADKAMATRYRDLYARSNAGMMSDQDFLAELSELSGEPVTQLEAEFRDKHHLNRPLAKLITTLKPAYKIGILSNTSRGMLDEFLDEHHIRHLFDVVLASSETGYVKPQREIFEIMAEKLGIGLHEMLFIDDSVDNVDAAQSYGMKTHQYITVAGLQSVLPQLLHL